ncbi:hypothetical protein [Burkholderia gladioli]
MEIATKEEAIKFLGNFLAKDDKDVPPVKILGDLARLQIHIEGEGYEGSFPGEFARGLWEFQESIYNAVAFTLYGTPDIRKLTAAQKDDFMIVFSVEKGSLGIEALLEKFFDKVSDGFAQMDSKHKMVSLVAVAVIIATAYGAVSIVESSTEAKKAQIEAALKTEEIDSHTKQMQILADAVKQVPAAQNFAKATEEGARAIVKRAHGATEVKIGALKFDHHDIEEVNQRANKEKAAAEIVSEDFVITSVVTKESATTKFTIFSPDTGEFSAIMQDEDFDADSLKKIWEAVQGRKKIHLDINVTKVRGTIKSGQILKAA